MPADPAAGFAAILERLDAPRGRVLYVQSSMDWIQRAGFAAADVMRTLKEWIDRSGTLVMPSYPSALPHLEYLAAKPMFDVRKTPTVSGLLAEMLRRTADVARSLDPDFPVCALGAEAGAIAGPLPDEADPFGAHSPYQRMLDRRAILLGLGVSWNTSSFIHVIDSREGRGYPYSPYDAALFDTVVVDRDGHPHDIQRRAILPVFQQLTMPSAVIDAMTPDARSFTTFDVDDVRFFRWDLDAWSAWCRAHARARAAEGGWPCWLTRLSDAA